MTGPDPVQRLAAALARAGASPPNPTQEAPVWSAGPSALPTLTFSDRQSDQSPAPAAAPSTVSAPQAQEIGPGDLVVAVLAGHRTLCAVQRVRRSDTVAIVRPLDQLDSYDRVPAAQLHRVATFDELLRWAPR